MTDLNKKAETAKSLLTKAHTDLEFAAEALRECGVDPDRSIEAQLDELDEEAAEALAHAEKLLEALDAILEGS